MQDPTLANQMLRIRILIKNYFELGREQIDLKTTSSFPRPSDARAVVEYGGKEPKCILKNNQLLRQQAGKSAAPIPE